MKTVHLPQRRSSPSGLLGGIRSPESGLLAGYGPVMRGTLGRLLLQVRKSRTKHPAVHHDFSLWPRVGWYQFVRCARKGKGYNPRIKNSRVELAKGSQRPE